MKNCDHKMDRFKVKESSVSYVIQFNPSEKTVLNAKKK